MLVVLHDATQNFNISIVFFFFFHQEDNHIDSFPRTSATFLHIFTRDFNDFKHILKTFDKLSKKKIISIANNY